MDNGIIRIEDLHVSLKEPQYDTPQTTIYEVTRLNCLNKNLVSLVITGKTIVNLLGVAGDCEDISLWTTYQSTLALDNTKKITGNNSIKVTINNTFGDSKFSISKRIDFTKKYGVSVYAINGNLSGNMEFIIEPVGQGIGVTKFYTLDTTKFNRYVAKFDASLLANSTDVLITFRGHGASGQYFYHDAVQIEEITAEDYNNPDWQPSPYVSNDTSVGDTAGRIKSIGKNLFNGKWELGTYQESYYAKMAYAPAIRCDNLIEVNPNTQYYCKNYTDTNAVLNVFMYDENLSFVSHLGSSGGTGPVITTGSTTKYIAIVYANTTDLNTKVQLEEGATATTYEDYQETVMPIYPLKSLPSGVADTQDTKKGKVYKRLEKVLLDGSLGWLYNRTVTGFKEIKVPLSGANIAGNAVAYKYNNKLLYSGDTGAIADRINIYTDGYLYISIPQADSGWGDSYTPTADEIKAYFYGWKMTVAETWASTGYNGTGTKGWGRADSSGNIIAGSGVTTCPTTLAPNFTPYRLYYQLVSTQEIDIPVSDLVGLPGGSLIMENDAQCWVRPSVAYTPNKNSRANLESLMVGVNNAVKVLAPKKQNDWIAPTLLNGWVNYGGGSTVAGYYKDSLGIVHLKGLIKGGTMANATALFTLPSGYRPAITILVPIIYTNGTSVYVGALNILGDGIVSLNGTISNNVWLSLDNVSFRLDN